MNRNSSQRQVDYNYGVGLLAVLVEWGKCKYLSAIVFYVKFKINFSMLGNIFSIFPLSILQLR
jgi:hypothetical protein